MRPSVGAAPARWNDLVTLAGSSPPHLHAARRLTAVPATRTMALGISLRLRDEAALRQALHDIYDPASPRFHHFLTVPQFRARFAPLEATRQSVVRWLQGQGLRVTGESANGLEILAAGPAGRVVRAFHTHLDLYADARAQFIANTAPARIPVPLASAVLAVSGLNTLPVARPLGLTWQPEHHAASPAGYWPEDLARLYNLNPLYKQGATGHGQTIGLVEYSDYRDENIATYDRRFSTSGTSERVPITTPDGQAPPIGTDAESECELDIEVVHALAPGVHALVYEAPNHEVGELALWNRVVSDRRAPVVSVSWGGPEAETALGDAHALNQLFEEAAVQGQSIFVAAGDNGAYDAGGKKLAVDFPASNPWVTAVGGTALHAAPDGSYGNESAWGNMLDGSGGGGGLSTIFQRPSYQAGPGVAERQSNGMRQVPDVAANADPDTGYATYTIHQGTTDWYVIGGTSAAAPLWASYGLLLNRILGKPLGFLNPTLYTLGRQSPAPFHDVTSGTNLYYHAGPGWDFATGWGSFDGAALLAALQRTGLTPFQLPAADFYLEAQVVIRSGGDLIQVNKVSRNQRVTLLTYVYLNRLSGDIGGTRVVTLSGHHHTLLKRTVSDQFTMADAGHTLQRTLSVKIPKKAPRGTYTLSVRETIGDQGERASTRVTVQ